MGAERTAAITSMEAMGFERSQIEAAMRAAFNNPDRAVEYLLTVSPASYTPHLHKLQLLMIRRASPTTSSKSNSSVRPLPLPLHRLPPLLLPLPRPLLKAATKGT